MTVLSVCKERRFLFHTTHINDPLPAATGLKVLEIVVRFGLVARSRASGRKLHAPLQNLMSQYGCIGDLQARGLMASIEIVVDQAGKNANIQLGNRLSKNMIELGHSANLVTMAKF